MKVLEKQNNISSVQAEQFLTGLRSVRKYKDIPIERNKIEQILDIARKGFSGANTQGVSYVVIDNRDRIRKLKDIIIPTYTEALKIHPEYDILRSLRNHCTEDNVDTIMWDAPCLVLSVCRNKAFDAARVDSVIALTYARLYAQTIGIGSCWAGAVETAVFNKMPQIKELLECGDDFEYITAAVMFGYPKYREKRVPDRNPLQIQWND